MKKATAFLLFGLAKTGTTTIQRNLFDNRNELLKYGILWPGFSSNHHELSYLFSVLPKRFSFAQLREGINSHDSWKQKHEEINTKFEKDICKSDFSKLVVSAEAFSVLTEAEMYNLKAFINKYCQRIRVIVYVRDPLKRINSNLLQHIRGGRSFSDSIKGVSHVFPEYR